MKLVFAANNGEIGGGEVMLLALAREAKALGHDVLIVGPRQPDSLVTRALAEGLNVTTLASDNRLQYMISLRLWRIKNRSGIFWCNGLLPAVSTSGMKDRLVHLHQLPSAKLRYLVPLAVSRARRVIVPSTYLRQNVPGSIELPNWNAGIPMVRKSGNSDEIRIGYIGRFSSGKGLPNLIQAVNLVGPGSQKSLKLIVAGEPRFTGNKDKQRIEESIKQSVVPIDQVGWVLPADFFSQVDFVVVPSVAPESFGLVATEAISAKMPIIVSDAGALPEIVGKDYPWISRAGDVESLAVTLASILEVPFVEIQAVVERSHSRWKKLYSPEAGRQRLNILLNSLEKA